MKTSRAPGRVTLPRALSKLGMASRSQAMGLIEKGLVSVNGKLETNPHRWVDIDGDRIELKDKVLKQKVLQYVILNKPPGYVTTTSDERGQKTVFDLLGSKGDGLFPVGRLDKETSGLLLFTNDQQFANQLTSPESGIFKTYLVMLDEPVSNKELLNLSDGLDIEIRGQMHRTKPAHVAQVSPGLIEISISEGRNRQIRRMMEALGREVTEMKRTSVGSLQLGSMKEGEFRNLSKEEADKLRAALPKSSPTKRKIRRP